MHLTNAEAIGGGTIAYHETEDRILPHIHVSVGLKEHSATAHQPPAVREDPVFSPKCSSSRSPDPRWGASLIPTRTAYRYVSSAAPDHRGTDLDLFSAAVGERGDCERNVYTPARGVDRRWPA